MSPMCFPLLVAASVINTLLPAPLVLDPTFTRLPTGSVKPSGWAWNMALVQANGLASQQPVWFSYVKNSVWQGGMLEYSEMQEAAPYWFNGWVALAYQTQNETLREYTKTFLDYVYASQESSGYFGPYPFDSSLPTLLWPRYMTMLGLIQYAEADASETSKISDLLHAFVPYAAEKFASGDLGDPSLGEQYGYQQVRWEEVGALVQLELFQADVRRKFVLVLQWLYDNDPRGQQTQLISLMKAARAQGFSWKDDLFVDNGTFPRTAVPAAEAGMHNHALKSEALAWRMTGEQSDIDSTTTDVLKAFSTPMNIWPVFTHQEGAPQWADLLERVAYNSLPAQARLLCLVHVNWVLTVKPRIQSTPDWWAHQYLQQTNQIWVANHSQGVVWTDGPYSNVMGMEPNYPCCSGTVNHPQGWPKFWSNSFLLADNGTALVHAFLGPATVSTKLADGVSTSITVKTDYPFGSTLIYEVTSSAPFTFYIRIPSWAQLTSTIAVNGGDASALSPDTSSSLQSVRVGAGITSVELFLDMQTEIEQRSNGSIAVYRGPLLYAVDLGHNDTTTLAMRSSGPLEFLETLPNVPAADLTLYDNHTHDHTWVVTTPWNVAIDPSTLEFHEQTISELPYYVWETGAQPQSMTATACEVEWPTLLGDANWPPANASCLGGSFEVTLRPFVQPAGQRHACTGGQGHRVVKARMRVSGNVDEHVGKRLQATWVDRGELHPQEGVCGVAVAVLFRVQALGQAEAAVVIAAHDVVLLCPVRWPRKSRLHEVMVPDVLPGVRVDIQRITVIENTALRAVRSSTSIAWVLTDLFRVEVETFSDYFSARGCVAVKQGLLTGTELSSAVLTEFHTAEQEVCKPCAYVSGPPF
ncbi:predicted protein [Postia placenta Mad-698-R]|nr:predicted protein [Postia placenta Mad-698-R]